ncbi:MAG: ABC transporter substrate-binding protein [Casimicrobiaceae bacterium]
MLATLLACTASPLASFAQQAGRIYKLGVLYSGAGKSMQPHRDVIRAQLATHGFVEGRNLQMTWRGGGSLRDIDRKTANELVAAGPDAVLAFSAEMTQAVQFATKSIPIVFAQVSDPIADGVVRDYAHPGANTTGVSTRHRELLGKRFELLREIAPKAKRVALVTPYATDPALMAARPAIMNAAKRLDFELIEIISSNTFDIEEKHAEAMFVYSVLGENFTMDNLIALSVRLRIPSIFPDAQWVARGGLLSYGTDPLWDTRLAADLLARVLSGAKPGDQPVDQNSRFVLAINLATAKALGLTIPQSLLLRADEVIQ